MKISLVHIWLIKMFLLTTMLVKNKEYSFFQMIIIVELSFMKTKITLGHNSTWINLSTLSWKHDTHETNNALQL